MRTHKKNSSNHQVETKADAAAAAATVTIMEAAEKQVQVSAKL